MTLIVRTNQTAFPLKAGYLEGSVTSPMPSNDQQPTCLGVLQNGAEAEILLLAKGFGIK